MHGAANLTTKQALLHERRRIASKRRRTFFLFLFFLLVIGFFVIIRKPIFRIQNVKVSGNTLVSTDDVKTFIESKLVGYRFFLIPRNSIIFFKKDQIESSIKDAFPRLSKVTITAGTNLNVIIAEPIFESMYCNLSGVDILPMDCALLHPDGKTGSMAPVYSYSPFFTFYKIESELPKSGTHVISLDEITRVNGIKMEVESYNIPVIGFVYGTEYDEVLLNTGSSFKNLPRIRILPNVKSTDISKTLGIAAKDEGIKKVLIDKLNDLEYIDLRFSGQVVYKKKSE